MKISNTTYDILKYVSLIVLPALCVLASSLTLIWDIPHADEIVRTIAALDTFFGAVTVIFKKNYDKENNNNEKEED